MPQYADRLKGLNWLAAALLVLSVALLGFGHGPSRSDAPDKAFAVWLQAGGTLDDLCLTEGDDPVPGHHPDCPACALAKAIALPPVQRLPAPRLRYLGAEAAPNALHLTYAHIPRAPPARGPPASLA